MPPAALRTYLPFLAWFSSVTRASLADDLWAGITNAIIVLPQGVAFAMIAGLPPEYGLYTAIVPPIIAGLFGSSRHLISGPTTAISIVVFSSISPLAEPGSARFIELALTLTFIAGAYQLALGLARMGALVNFISHSVVVGFTAGAAILIATGQVKNVLGAPIPAGESFLSTWLAVAGMLDQVNPMALSIAALTLAVAVGFKVFKPRWPGMLAAMVAGSLAAYLMDGDQGSIKLVGALPSTLPPLSLPDFSMGALRVIAPQGLAVALLGLIEAVAIARSIAIKSHQRIDGSQEFIGQGLSNVVGSFFSCYASSGSFTRSGLNYDTGAKTPLAAVFAAVSLALVVLLVAPLAAYLPIPAMGGVVMLVAYNLVDFHHIRQILSTSRAETAVLSVTFFATLFLELEFAIYAGVLLSLVLYLNRTSKPRIVSRVPDLLQPGRPFITDPDLPECPQVKILRVDGSLYFGSVNHVEEEFRLMDEQEPEQVHLLLVCSGINFVDAAGAELLVQEARRRRTRGGGLYLYGVKLPMRDFLRRGGYLKEIGEENIYCSKKEAIAAIFAKLRPERCRRCDETVFLECQTVKRDPDIKVFEIPATAPGRPPDYCVGKPAAAKR
ncbi:MAG: SulP family inorganic anion transporter [Nitrospinae bacterium]|nr:SulP family inorganic anion transporter [Nitrospinota bacterium]